MKVTKVKLIPLTVDDREQFIKDNQRAFKYGAIEEFGNRDDHFDDDGEIISRETIERCIDESKNDTFRIIHDGKKVGGVIVGIDKETQLNHLEILFVSPEEHTKGIGFGAWQEIEKLYPDTKVWETFTPYFEKRNIHFYVNKCGFKVVEFFNDFHREPDQNEKSEEGPDEMFRFEKIMKRC
ncbi:MAG: GNAT family N-acetyltransferase [Clostridia bacterium]|nr:GNAT family N-acetyltransferase [Clostridia bacterium]